MKNPRKRKTRKLTDKELSERLQGCPWCGGKIVTRERTRTDPDTGKRRGMGSFFGCSNFDVGCGYYVSLDGIEKVHPDELERAA